MLTHVKYGVTYSDHRVLRADLYDLNFISLRPRLGAIFSTLYDGHVF